MSYLKRLIDRTLNPESGSAKVKPAITPDSIPENLEVKVRPSSRLMRTPPPEPTTPKLVQATPSTVKQQTDTASDKSLPDPRERSQPSKPPTPPMPKNPIESSSTAAKVNHTKTTQSQPNRDDWPFPHEATSNPLPRDDPPSKEEANEEKTFDLASSKHTTNLAVSAEKEVERSPIEVSSINSQNGDTQKVKVQRIQNDVEPAKIDDNTKSESKPSRVKAEAHVQTQSELDRNAEKESLRDGNAPTHPPQEELPVEPVRITSDHKDTINPRIIKQAARLEQLEGGAAPFEEPGSVEPTNAASGDFLNETPEPRNPQIKPPSKPDHKIEAESEKRVPEDIVNKQVLQEKIEDGDFSPQVMAVAPVIHETRYQAVQEPSETVVTINIGRIEVRSITPTSPVTESKAEFSPPLTLSDYLKRRAEGKRG
ncbi:MAG: hypothetical protein M1503_02950 [Thaumarchaeota archaeon]|nr:hypothetical protein [Nitrososphaerota archaeon]MCL5317210.1 hypothetical protein [Nitrososphaerota archaeon]